MRGRQKGEKKRALTITDPILEPYYIIKDQDNFILMVRGNSMDKVLGYYTKLDRAILKVTQEKVEVEHDGKIFNSIDEYTQVISQQNNILKQLVHGA